MREHMGEDTFESTHLSDDGNGEVHDEEEDEDEEEEEEEEEEDDDDDDDEVEEENRSQDRGSTPCASRCNRNAHGHSTRAILC